MESGFFSSPHPQCKRRELKERFLNAPWRGVPLSVLSGSRVKRSGRNVAKGALRPVSIGFIEGFMHIK